MTGDNLGRRLAIVVEGRVDSAPQIESRISGGRVRITPGWGTDPVQQLQAAREQVAALSAGALPAPLQLVRQERIGPGPP